MSVTEKKNTQKFLVGFFFSRHSYNNDVLFLFFFPDAVRYRVIRPQRHLQDDADP